jgi:hypothetical protein
MLVDFKKPLMKNLPVIFLLLLLAACGSAVTFTSPQPAGARNLRVVPKALRGAYGGDFKDGTYITIVAGKDSIYMLVAFTEMKHREELDSSFLISGDSVRFPGKENWHRFRSMGDSLAIDVRSAELLFSFKNGDVLRKQKNAYYLSSGARDAWTVDRLEASSDSLIWSCISGEETQLLEQIVRVQHVGQDSSGYSPTRREFKKFVRQGGFSQRQAFARLK